MKRLFILLVAVIMLVVMSGCGARLSQSQMEQTLSEFVTALRVYDRQAMTKVLTEFPDKTPYVYLDDIFNDEGYVELYQLLYADIQYRVVQCEKNQMTVEFTMPDVQSMYVKVMGVVFQMALSDPVLEQKLSENDANGSILVREIMLSQVKQGQVPPTFTESFTLEFIEKDGRIQIVCDDAVRTVMTGKFFLSKNATVMQTMTD
ncbi:MAG: hypothetical protein IJD09_00770 [Clostridia bacterium]|nr:hypothetical protein [Clostridia bacterium]